MVFKLFMLFSETYPHLHSRARRGRGAAFIFMSATIDSAVPFIGERMFISRRGQGPGDPARFRRCTVQFPIHPCWRRIAPFFSRSKNAQSFKRPPFPFLFLRTLRALRLYARFSNEVFRFKNRLHIKRVSGGLHPGGFCGRLLSCQETCRRGWSRAGRKGETE